MNRTVVLNVVGLTAGLIGPNTPKIDAFVRRNRLVPLVPAFPAVTCTAQSNYLTGAPPSQHGIVGNGWYHRELAEVHFWKQSNHVVHGRKIWDELRGLNPNFTCANAFWWYNMHSSVDYAITPRPMYPADGRKVFDIYSWPYSIRPEIKAALGEFPFPTFWGPAAGLATPQGAPDAVSRWIAQAARWLEERYQPTLSLVYLPHLDYNLQRLGPTHAEIPHDLRRIDAITGELIDFFTTRGVQVILLSEYGITPVQRPIHLNRHFREQGWLIVKDELGHELLDAGASHVFAVADHQVAHVYVRDPKFLRPAQELMEKLPGIEQILGPAEQRQARVNHTRAGDLIALAAPDAWFTYYYWEDDQRAPDFARCVDIHRKPGYDPVELFLDPTIPWVRLKILWRLAQKKMGFRMLMDVIPLDAQLVRGSHGRPTAVASEQPVLVAPHMLLPGSAPVDSTDVYGLIRNAVVGSRPEP